MDDQRLSLGQRARLLGASSIWDALIVQKKLIFLSTFAELWCLPSSSFINASSASTTCFVSHSQLLNMWSYMIKNHILNRFPTVSPLFKIWLVSSLDDLMVVLELLGKRLCFSSFFGISVGLSSAESRTELVMGEKAGDLCQLWETKSILGEVGESLWEALAAERLSALGEVRDENKIRFR